MRKKEKPTPHKQSGVFFVVFLIICLITGIFCFQYYYQLRDTIRAESGTYLREIASRTGRNVKRSIDDNYALMQTMLSAAEITRAESSPTVQVILQGQQAHWNYKDFLFVDENGKAFSEDGKDVSLGNRDYFRQAMAKG